VAFPGLRLLPNCISEPSALITKRVIKRRIAVVNFIINKIIIVTAIIFDFK
jgi:hypothetical protein